jgi:ADP-heptose:LPS heptosyltransferase
MDTTTSTTTAPDGADGTDTSDNCENKIISETVVDTVTETVTRPKTQQDLIREHYQNLQKHKYERFIEITMNQTTYTREEAIASLEKHKGDITLVIKEFLGIPDKREEREKERNSKSLNQKRYNVIRECMDGAAKNFAIKQEQAKRYNEMIERRQQKLNEENTGGNK